jgi:lipopolysaccharide transport system ATP-binding protein
LSKIKIRIFTIEIPLNNYPIYNEIINLKITIPSKFLVPGSYSWLICITHPNVVLYDLQDDVCQFNILETGSIFSKYKGIDFGSVYPPDYKVESLTVNVTED